MPRIQNAPPESAEVKFGLIAEEAAEVNPDLVVRDGNGESTPSVTTR
jgi:hypothetical protein